MTVQGDKAGARKGVGLPYFQAARMASYIIEIWKDDEVVQSIAGKWSEDEARRLTMYYLGYYHAAGAQLLRSPCGRLTEGEIIWEVYAPA